MRIIFLIVVVLTSLISGCDKTAQPAAMDYQTLDGRGGRFEDFRGRWLLINYWAAWCAPCIKEIPELMRFQQKHGERAALLTVNFDGAQGAELQQQVDQVHMQLPVMLEDPAKRLNYQRPEALPSTFVFGPDGKLVQVLQGEQTEASLAAAIGAAESAHKP